jgi:hypothetical protein
MDLRAATFAGIDYWPIVLSDSCDSMNDANASLNHTGRCAMTLPRSTCTATCNRRHVHEARATKQAMRHSPATVTLWCSQPGLRVTCCSDTTSPCHPSLRLLHRLPCCCCHPHSISTAACAPLFCRLHTNRPLQAAGSPKGCQQHPCCCNTHARETVSCDQCCAYKGRQGA